MNRMIVASAVRNAVAVVSLFIALAILKRNENLVLLSAVCSAIAGVVALHVAVRTQRASR